MVFNLTVFHLYYLDSMIIFGNCHTADVCDCTTQAYICLTKKSKKLLYSEKLPLLITSAKATEHKHQPNLSHKDGASCRFLPSESLDFIVIKSFAARDESPAFDLVSKKPHLILYRYLHLKWNR